MLEFQRMFQEDESSFYLRLKVIALTGTPGPATKAIEIAFAYGRGRPKVLTELSGPGGDPLESEFPTLLVALKKIAGEPVEED